ncbi:MAG: hypothetical protein GFH27_549291n367 [Chloroflexi bacterium AL-W]|nr:hypothetical protein [Chloroflexi bacterium AL-N1]NOK67165.1 hypothetical protein [Chloroflexi bacterium AL-N10]NOK75341.1 hypothetical protein [Chloroflexi bacterium AL-N5]NOK82129.1 hypothetical protein [Chloroflexi bacterium AL-W]NOK89974.1 hypothetical protein [Chloroflexi bacterium AL-N15]
MACEATLNSQQAISATEARDWMTQAAASSLSGLVVLNGITLVGFYTGVEPHPPAAFVPLIAATVALSVTAIPLALWRNRITYISVLLAALLSFVSFGPHKFLVENALQLSPALIIGTMLSVTAMIAAVVAWRDQR